MTLSHLDLARQVSGLFASLPQVEAVALGGSRANSKASTDSASDIDVYVYTRAAVPLVTRHEIVERLGGATRADLGLEYWGPGDEWFHAPTGIEIDIVYFDATWMEEQLTRVSEQHQASMGYSTCFWHTVRQSIVLHDPNGWFAVLQHNARAEYPEALRQNIISLNQPVLRQIIPSYAFQIEKAAKRGDLVSVNHRLAALLASYFDILFAFNRQLHPGEKRMLEFALQNCAALPENFEADLTAVLRAAGADLPALPRLVDTLLNHLELLIASE
jgi:hypothetical protein